MSDTVTRPVAALQALAERALAAAGASARNAASTADALIAAELDGLPSHGLSRIPFYADQLAARKLDGSAVPVLTRSAGAVVHVDARDGFAYPAIAMGVAEGHRVAREAGLCAVAITRSHHCGALGPLVERIAEAGFIGLLFTNSPAAIAPWGGRTALFGTNPLAFAMPRPASTPLVIDLSLSVAARGKIMLAAECGEPIPEGWALDAEGAPTTDARAALAGTMLPLGGAKGAALALLVELLAAGMTRANFAFQASSFFDTAGPPSRIGQLALIFDPAAFGGPALLAHCETLLSAITAQGARLPGERRRRSRARMQAEGITLPSSLYEELERRAGNGK